MSQAGTGHGSAPARGPAADLPEFTLARATQLLAEQSFTRWWGVRAVALGDGTAQVYLPSAPHLLRPGGVLHGSCYEMVADVAMWLAIMTRIGEQQMALTVEMKTNFLAGTAAGITGTARVIKLGRRIVVGTAAMVDDDGREVALSTLTYSRPVDPSFG